MYTIQCIIANRKVIEHEQTLGAKIVSLPQDMVLIPFAGTWSESKNIPLLPLTDGKAFELPAAIADLCYLLSKNGKLAYVEAEFFGGDGTQACSLWEKGTSFDEFEALNLGRFRETQAWLAGDGA
jgi:hypothetical protein